MLAARALRGQARRATALTTTRSIGYKRVLVVVKFTPYEAYTQLKLQGKAPKALRWERLKERHANHQACVEQVVSCLLYTSPSPRDGLLPRMPSSA